MNAVLAGECDLDAIADYVGFWHDGDDPREIDAFLGMSHLEYARWVESPEVLPLIVLAHRFDIPMTERVEIERAARSSGPWERAILDDWLSRSAIPA